MSGLGKDLLLFDSANPDTTDNVGAYIRGASGEIVTSSLVSGKQALDVNVVNSLTIDVDLDQSTDSVAIGDGTNLVSVSASGELLVRAVDLDIRDLAFATDKVDVSGSSVTAVVSATDLDIRNLVFATDKVDASGSVVELGATSLAALETITVLQGTSPWVVSATDLDIRDLSSATDSISAVASGNIADDAVDSGNPIKVGSRAVTGPLAAISAADDRADLISDLYRRIYVNDSANIGVASAAVSVAGTATNLAASALGGRRRMMILNNSGKPIYVGPSGVTTSSGLRIAAGGNMSLEIGPNVALYAIGDGSGQDARVFELA